MGDRNHFMENAHAFRSGSIPCHPAHQRHHRTVSLVADALRDCSHRKGLVLDPFCGSGTILIAAERTGRHARAIELDPHYVDVAVMRWQRVTGREAVLESTGQTWAQVREERLNQEAEASHGL
jgi:DNA modification methylase